jgi:hypothetical protein
VRKGAARAGSLLVCLLSVAPACGGSPEVTIETTDDLQKVVAAAPPGATLVLEAGIHRGPVLVARDLALTGRPGAVVSAPRSADAVLLLRGHGARVSGLELRGGSSGLSIDGADGVEVDDVVVRGADLHGIEVVAGSADISSVEVGDLRSPIAQGIEIRNSDGHPDTVVENSGVVGGQEGIVSHVSEVKISSNRVNGTTLRAIAVTEMSDGVISDNDVTDARGAGLYCGDMSRCEFRGNSVARVGPAAEGVRSRAGWGLVVQYHATASLHGDSLAGAAGPTTTMQSSRIITRSPLEPGAGVGALGPASIAVATAAMIVLVFFFAARAVMKRYPPRSPARRKVARAATAVMLVALAVQSFHIVEHVLQAFRVHADGVPSRGGIVGPAVDAEWIHFTYNAVVLGGMAVGLAARYRGWRPAGGARIGDWFLAAAVGIQSYHLVEHTFKVVQHVVTGAKVNPGILGASFNLVWLHFAINLAVYAAFFVACFAYFVRAQGERRLTGAPAPAS